MTAFWAILFMAIGWYAKTWQELQGKIYVHNGNEAMEEAHSLFLYYVKSGGYNPDDFQPPEVISNRDRTWQIRYYINRSDEQKGFFSPNYYFRVTREGSVEPNETAERAFKARGLICNKKPITSRIYYSDDLSDKLHQSHTCQ